MWYHYSPPKKNDYATVEYGGRYFYYTLAIGRTTTRVCDRGTSPRNAWGGRSVRSKAAPFAPLMIPTKLACRVTEYSSNRSVVRGGGRETIIRDTYVCKCQTKAITANNANTLGKIRHERNFVLPASNQNTKSKCQYGGIRSRSWKKKRLKCSYLARWYLLWARRQGLPPPLPRLTWFLSAVYRCGTKHHRELPERAPSP